MTTENIKAISPSLEDLKRDGVSYLSQTVEKNGIVSQPSKIEPLGFGASSVVFRIQAGRDLMAAKMTVAKGGVVTEGAFLREWRKAGIRVPEVYGTLEADMNTPAVLLMEVIDAPLVGKSTLSRDRVENGIARETGRSLAMMHTVASHGFGIPIIEGDSIRGKHAQFKKGIEATLSEKKLRILQETGLLTDSDLSFLNISIDILQQDLESGTRPCLTHNDLHPLNIFDTKPITVFDPAVRITHPMICLAYSLALPLVDDPQRIDESHEIRRGYEEISAVDDRVLNAATVIRGFEKLYTWQEQRLSGRVTRLREIISNCEAKL